MLPEKFCIVISSVATVVLKKESDYSFKEQLSDFIFYLILKVTYSD